MGYGAGFPGVGDKIDHLNTVSGFAFSYPLGGLKWSKAFPAFPPEPRIGHNAMVGLLKDAEAGASSAMASLKNWVMTEGYRAPFDPGGNFSVLELTV